MVGSLEGEGCGEVLVEQGEAAEEDVILEEEGDGLAGPDLAWGRYGLVGG